MFSTPPVWAELPAPVKVFKTELNIKITDYPLDGGFNQFYVMSGQSIVRVNGENLLAAYANLIT
jgi:hypothetical protein